MKDIDKENFQEARKIHQRHYNVEKSSMHSLAELLLRKLLPSLHQKHNCHENLRSLKT